MNAPFAERKHNKSAPEITFIAREHEAQAITGFEKAPTHEITLLEHANIAVRLSTSERLRPGAIIECSVARNVESNGRVVIPAGAPCRIRVLSLQANTATVTLAAVTVRNRSYELFTSTGNIRNGFGGERYGNEVSFPLRAPVAFTE